jgi:hypothetical protein
MNNKDRDLNKEIAELCMRVVEAAYGKDPNVPFVVVDIDSKNDHPVGFILAVHWEYFKPEHQEVKQEIQNIRSFLITNSNEGKEL